MQKRKCKCNSSPAQSRGGAMHVESSRKAKQKYKKKKTTKKMENKKKRNLFLNRSQVWRASEMARGCEKNVSCDKAGKNWRGGCVEKMHGKWKRKNGKIEYCKEGQVEAEVESVLSRSWGKVAVWQREKKQLRNSSDCDCDGDSDCDDDNDGTKGTIARNDENWQQTNDGCTTVEWVRFGACVRVCVRTVCGCVLARSWAGILLCEHKTCCWQLSHAVA